MINRTELLNAAEEIAKNIISYGGFSSEKVLAEKVNLTKKTLYGGTMWGDLGDYAPFFYWLGEISKNDKYKEFSLNQARMAAEEMENKKSTFSSNGAADFILGLTVLYRLSGKKHLKEAADNFYSYINQITNSDGFIPAYVLLGIKAPLSASGYTGVFIEELCELFEIDKNGQNLDIAKRMTNPWINEKGFKEHSLYFLHFSGMSKNIVAAPLAFAIHITPDTAVMMKPNTNFIFGISKLYSLLKDSTTEGALISWMEAIEKKMLNKGFFYSYYDSKTGKARNITLETNHAVIDALIEIYLSTSSKKALELAQRCIESWLSIQSKSGLVPNSPEEKMSVLSFDSILPERKVMYGAISRLDSQTDFSIVLLKMYCLTKKVKYLNAAEQIIRGIMDNHKYDGGYVEFVNIQTLEKTGFETKTKYQTLMIKLLLCTYEVLNGKNIATDKTIKTLVRDR